MNIRQQSMTYEHDIHVLFLNTKIDSIKRTACKKFPFNIFMPTKGLIIEENLHVVEPILYYKPPHQLQKSSPAK